MGLRTKIFAALICIMSLLAIPCVLFYTQVFKPSCSAMEEREARDSLERVVNAIQNEIDHLSALNHDWSAWDATYNFVQTGSDSYITENLPSSIFAVNNINLLHFYDTTGKLIWGESYNLGSGEQVRLQGLSAESLPVSHPLLAFNHNNAALGEVETKGVWMTGMGPMLIASRPILRNDHGGPVQGTLVLGRFLDDKTVAKIRDLTRVNFQLRENYLEYPASSIQPAAFTQVPEGHFDIARVSDDNMEVFFTLSDITGEHGVPGVISIDRVFFARSQVLLNYAVVTIFTSIIVVFVLLLFFMQRIVIGPIDSLTKHILEINKTGNLAAKIEVVSNDEIGILEKEFNSMIEKLHSTKHKLQEQAFQQGMAELASGILHNVRNSLHKMFSNCENIRKTMDRIPVQKLAMARDELSTDLNNEERKKDLTEFLDSTNDTLLLFISQARDQLNRNHPLVEEIEKTLKSYEKWAFGEKLAEKILIGPLLHEAFQILNKPCRETIFLEIKAGINEIGYVESNRVILIQVIINLLKNAAESICQMKEGVRGKISVDAEDMDTEVCPAAHITFTDNGAGIEKDILPRIFDRGFSSKIGDNIGLGLNWCRDAVESMGGKIYAESEGPDQGACFHLILPRIVEDAIAGGVEGTPESG